MTYIKWSIPWLLAAAAVAQQEDDYEQEEVEDRENAADNMEDEIEDEVEEGVNGFEADLLEVLEDAQPGQLVTIFFSVLPLNLPRPDTGVSTSTWAGALSCPSLSFYWLP